MKRTIAILCLVAVFTVLALSGCVLTHVSSQSPVYLHFRYEGTDITTALEPEEAERVTDILNHKIYDPLIGRPACGFNKNISLQVGSRYFALALDSCNCFEDCSTFRYFDVPKEDMEYIHALFEKYCGFEKYGGFY